MRSRGGVRRAVRGLVHELLAPHAYRVVPLCPDPCAVCQYPAYLASDLASDAGPSSL